MRLFLAISIDGTMQDALLKLQEHWQTLGVRGHFVPAEKMHLTLAFIGEYGNPDMVMDAISTVSFTPFSLQLDGAGNFHDTLWAGIAPNEALSACVRRLRRALAEQEIPYDRKKYAPHITLVRRADFPGSVESLLSELPTDTMDVMEISLMRSDRGKNGMIYTKIGCLEADSL